MAERKTDRDSRLKTALRDNLRKRKAQDREARAHQPDPQQPVDESDISGEGA